MVLAFTFGNAQETFTQTTDLPIPDNDPVGVTQTLNVSTGTITNITDIDVVLLVDHTWIGDLNFTLTSPDLGTIVTIIDRPGRDTAGAGCSGDDISCTINDEGADGPAEDNCIDGTAGDPDFALSGDFTIAGSVGQPSLTDTLDLFDGEDPNGDWTLTVSDNAGGDTGTVLEWSLIITGNTLGLDDPNAQTFTFSPNPVKNVLNLNAAKSITNVEVYNLIGQQVMRAAPNTVTSQLDMSQLNAGAYFVRISVGDVTDTIKIIKE